LIGLKVAAKNFSDKICRRQFDGKEKILSGYRKDFEDKDVLMVRLIIPVVAATTAAAVIATFFIATAATAAAEAPLFVTATAAAAALLLGLRFVDDDLTAHNFAVVQVSNGLLRLAIVFHFDKTEALAATGDFVLDDFSGSNCAVLFKKIPEILIGHLPGEVAYINVHCTKN